MRNNTKHLQILDYIKNFIEENNYCPTIRDIAQEFNIKSTSTVQYYLNKLKDAGLINQSKYIKRSLCINANSDLKTCFAPLIGNVSAGQGILAVENFECSVPLPASIFGNDDLFVLRVQGQSMVNAGIDDGDLVVVRKQSDATVGEIVVVYWQENATVKRLLSKKPNLVLHPENDSMTDIVIQSDETAQILGKVVGCIKKFA